MVEEMYLEETKEQEQQNGSEDKTTKSENNEDSTSKSNTQQEKSPVTENQNRSFKTKLDSPRNQNNNTTPPSISVTTVSLSPTGLNMRNQPGFTLIGSPKMEGIAQGSPKKQPESIWKIKSNELTLVLYICM